VFTRSLHAGSAVAAALAAVLPTFCAPMSSVTTMPGQEQVRIGRYVVTTPVPGVTGEVIRTASISAVKYRSVMGSAKVMFRFSCTGDPRLPESVSDFHQLPSEIVKSAARLDLIFHTRTTYLAAPVITFRGLPAQTMHWRYRDGDHVSDTESLNFLAAGDVYSVSRSLATRGKPPTRAALAEADRRWRDMIRHLHQSGKI